MNDAVPLATMLLRAADCATRIELRLLSAALKEDATVEEMVLVKETMLLFTATRTEPWLLMRVVI